MSALTAVDRRNRWLVALAFLVGLVATVGSIYYSEVRYFVPCELCWYQRYWMYPQVILLGLALLRNDWNIKLYALPLSLVGIATSVYHLLEQNFPGIFARACKSAVPCSIEYIPSFPIPAQALVAFVIITVALLLVRRKS